MARARAFSSPASPAYLSTAEFKAMINPNSTNDSLGLDSQPTEDDDDDYVDVVKPDTMLGQEATLTSNGKNNNKSNNSNSKSKMDVIIDSSNQYGNMDEVDVKERATGMNRAVSSKSSGSSSHEGDTTDEENDAQYQLYDDEERHTPQSWDSDPFDFDPATSPRKLLCGVCHLMEIIVLTWTVGSLSYFAFNWDWFYSLCIHFAFMTLQIILSLDKLPGLRLNTEAYLNSPIVESALEETIHLSRCFPIKPRKIYVVKYAWGKEHYMCIRKPLEPSLYDGDMMEMGDIQDLVFVNEDAPYSAYPKIVIELHHARYKLWLRYGVPLLLLTFGALAYNLLLIIYVYGYHKMYPNIVITTISVNVILAIAIVLPLAYKLRKWKVGVGMYGNEVSVKELGTVDTMVTVDSV